ncbi:MAG: DUF2073 domain-containing protein [archaeon]
MLTLQFVPYHEIENLTSARRIKKLMDIVKDDKIILLEGRLTKEEEKDLIEITMEEIDERFKGIELSVVNPENKSVHWLEKARKGMINILLGNRQGFTIIGPATVVKEIKRDPEKIELLTNDLNKKRRRRRK